MRILRSIIRFFRSRKLEVLKKKIVRALNRRIMVGMIPELQPVMDPILKAMYVIQNINSCIILNFFHLYMYRYAGKAINICR